MLATEISPPRTATNAQNIVFIMMSSIFDEEFESPAQEVDVRREKNRVENIPQKKSTFDGLKKENIPKTGRSVQSKE